MRLQLIAAVLLLAAGAAAPAPDPLTVGVAAVDITPDYPVRLSGFGFRRTESEGVSQRIWAKALAFDGGGNGPAVLVTVDSLGVPLSMTKDVAARLGRKSNLDPTRFAITASHTHTAPMLTGVCPTLFGEPIPPEHQRRIDRYTKQLADALEQVALAALADLKPAKVEFGTGTSDLAINRRRQGGPVDHDLPVLVVRDERGNPRAIYLSYACHCVTLSHNQIGGDWAGYVQETLQKNHPGVIALTSIGCGADSNPSSNVTGDRTDVAAAQGQRIAAEVDRLLKQQLAPITQPVSTAAGEVELLFDTHPTRGQWQEKARRQDAVGHHARVQLEKLDRGEPLQTRLDYPIQTWSFGEQLAMVFLPGEVVVDYSVRLKKEFDRSRLWINAYSNDAPCYIPSERILKEGGYEGSGAMIYYDRPTAFAPGLEQKIVDEIHRQIPRSFRASRGTEGIAPRSPEQSRRSIRTHPGLEVELVAAEPLVSSPVAIDWSADGRLWVCEMFDYPTGADQEGKPGGRVKFLEDVDGDGRYDKATVFLDHIPFPTGVTAWGRGVFVCAAPDILYARDTNADGKADQVDKVFTGFFTDNFQARVNSLSLGLDNWIYGANGLLGGVITDGEGKKLDIRNHDFRFRSTAGAATGPMELVTGLTQQGRVRDDWGRWFGCDNSSPLLYYPREQRYLRRNPHAPSPPPIIRPPGDYDVSQIYPASPLLERFNDPDNANRFTSACGLGIYRDRLLGEAFSGNAFVCESVHNLVHRMVLSGDGAGLTRRRGEGDDEFLASTDNWFRPVQVRTGPDGALYIVDMYRFLIEHPRWIPANRLTALDVRAGADNGRIYRIRPAGKPLRPVQDLTKLTGADLAAALDTPNGTDRDRVHAELLLRRDPAVAPLLDRVAESSALPEVRVQALCALEGLGGLSHESLKTALSDRDSRVRKHAVRLCETFIDQSGPALLSLINDPSPQVRHQLAYTLGEWNSPQAGDGLAALTRAHLTDLEMRTAVMSSAGPHVAKVLEAVAALPEDAPGRAEWMAPLVATAAASGHMRVLDQALTAVLPRPGAEAGTAHFTALASLLDAWERRNLKTTRGTPGVAATFAAARRVAADESAAPAERVAAVGLLGRAGAAPEDVALMCDLACRGSGALSAAALDALRRQSGRAVAAQLIARWAGTPPAARGALVNLLLSRDEWAVALVEAVRGGTVQRNELSLEDRRRLTESTTDSLRALAADVFPPHAAGARADVVARYKSVPTLAGDSSRGAEFFSRDCAACHALAGVGHDVGPDLAALRDKGADYFVQNILDPAAVVEPRFIYYQVVTKGRRSITGVIQSETGSAITLQSGNGVTETVARADVKEVRASGTSMMPEGFEAAYTPQQMADLVAFLKSGESSVPPSGVATRTPPLAASQSNPAPARAAPGDEVARTPAAVAKVILDKNLSNEAREAAVRANPQFAAELIAEMTRDLTPAAPAEYERIPWIWRVAVACGRRDDAGQIRKMLAVSLPQEGQSLHDWQAVVLGGGVVMGASERGHWPAKRVAEILADDPDLQKRWRRALDLASAMADDEKVPTPTRYDALRMLGAEPWEKRGGQLTRYLAKGTHEELQAGAVTGTGDVDAPQATAALVEALPHLAGSNRNLALDALLRSPQRITALLTAIESGKIDRAAVDAPRAEKLLNHPDAKVRGKAKDVLKQ